MHIGERIICAENYTKDKKSYSELAERDCEEESSTEEEKNKSLLGINKFGCFSEKNQKQEEATPRLQAA